MNNQALVWVIVALLGTVSLGFYLVRTYKLRAAGQWSLDHPSAKWIAAAILHIVGTIGYVLPTAAGLMQSISPLALCFCLAFAYLANKQLLFERVYPVFKSRLFWFTTTLVIVLFTLDSVEPGNPSVLFVRGRDIQSTPATSAYLVLYVIGLLIAEALIIRAFWLSLWRNQEMTFIIRRLGGLAGHVVIAITLTIAGMSVVWTIVAGNPYRDEFDTIVALGFVFACTLLLINIAPQRFLITAVGPIERYATRRKHHSYVTLLAFHHKTTSVVASVQRVHSDLLTYDRLVNEIGDDRDLIWSHIPHHRTVPPREEAMVIGTLLDRKAVISTAGPFQPPPAAQTTDRHILQLAQHLTVVENVRMTKPHQIPALPGPPLIGHLRAFHHDRLNLYVRAYLACGDVAYFRIGPLRVVMLNAPEHIRGLLVDHDQHVIRNPLVRSSLHAILGDGLLTSEGEVHRRQRKLVAPAFQHGRILSYADIMTSDADTIQQQWPDRAPIDIHHEMNRLTLGIVGKALFSTDLLSEADDLGAALTTLNHAANAKSSAVYPLPVQWLTPHLIRFRRALARVDATIYRIIAERQRSGEDAGDLLSMLLAARDESDGHTMSDREVRDEAMTLFVAGHETVACALSWTIYLLAHHPQVYRRLQDEVDHVLGLRTATVSDLPRLPFTLQVFKEALRLYPPAYVIPRHVVDPIELGRYRIPAGYTVIVSPYALHRRADYYPEPEQFDPDRWTPEQEAHLPRYAYLPFGTGPRVCIGNHFAMMEGHLVLATLAQHVMFESVPGSVVVPEPLITLRPRNGIHVIVRRRNHRGHPATLPDTQQDRIEHVA